MIDLLRLMINRSWDPLLKILAKHQNDSIFPCCFPGICDDRGIRVGVHHSNLVSGMLLSLQGMAGTPALRPQAFLCDRWAVRAFSFSYCCFYFSGCFFFFPFFSLRLFWDRCGPGRSRWRFQGMLVGFCHFQSEATFIFPPFWHRMCSVVMLSASTELRLYRYINSRCKIDLLSASLT